MDAWNIYHKDGSVLCDVDGNQVMFTSLENTDVWMGECSVSITVKNNSPIIFSIGDYVIYRNERYEINYDPGKIKASSKNTYGEGFVYNDIKFNSLSDELVRAEFLDVVLFEGTVNVDGIETTLHYTALPKFSFYVEFIDDLLDRIQANMNEQYGDGVWKIFSTNMERSVVRGCSESDWHNAYGDESKYIAIDSQSITVDNSTCWDALSLVNSKWDITFIVRGRNVYVGINGPKTPHVFKYGKGNGLREIEQTVDSDQNVITRLRAYGSDKNMPQRYYAELGKKCFANVTKVDKSVSNSIEITTDLPYNSTLFNTPRTYKTSEDSETFTLGWALKVTFDFQTVVTAHIEPTTTQDGYCIVHTELGEHYDTGDELDSVKLQKFIESASVGKKLYFTRGIYKSAFEKEFIEFDNNMPNNMAVNRLMLPGFPDTSLSAFWNTMTDEEKKYVNPTGSNIIFSEDKYRPYLDSPEKENAGLRQYSMYFDNDDKKNGIIEIYPTIEEMVVSGERIDEISVGSSIDDNGVFDDGQEVKDFYIKLKKQIDFDLNDVKNDDFSISLKDGMCGGRTFKINACTKESDGSWSLKCARVKDDALELWFPYKDYPIRKGDHFVLTGLELPDSYIRAASIKLLKYSISYLNSNCKTRYAFQLKVDDLFMARQHDLSVSDSSGSTKSLYKTLRAGDVMSIRDEDLGIDSDIVIEQLTIKEEEGNIPSYEITLRDDKSVGAITKIQDKIDSIYSAVGAGVTLNESQVESVVSKVAGKLFVTNDWFGRIFNIVDQYGNKQGENEGIAENSSIRAKMSLWSDGGISALGNSASSGGSGGGGLDAELLWSLLGNSGTEQISKSHIADALAGYATEEWVEGKGYLTNQDAYTKAEIDAKDWSSNKGTVTSVGIAMPTGFSVSGSPITEKGILAIGFATGYSLPTTAKQSNWDTVYNWYSGITGSDTDTIINKWGEIISFLDGIEDTATLSGIVNGINQSITAESNRAKGAEQTLTSSISTNTSAINVLKGYFTNGVAKSAVKLQTARKIWGNTFDGTQDVAGDLILPHGKNIVIGTASLSWDADNNAVKIDGSVYATGGVSALGNSDTTGGGGGGLMGTIVPYAKAITLTTQNEGAEIASAWSVKMLYDKIETIDVSGQLTSYLTKQEAQALYQPVGNYLTEHQDISGKADRSELLGYLPLTGGTLTGDLNLGSNTLFAKNLSLTHVGDNWNFTYMDNRLRFLYCHNNAAIGAPGAPASYYWSGISAITSYTGFQLVTHGGSANDIYFRKIQDNNTWHDWYRIYHEGFKPTKADVGLGNVDNTADANKSVSYAGSAGNADSVDNYHAADLFLTHRDFLIGTRDATAYQWNAICQIDSTGGAARSFMINFEMHHDSTVSSKTFYVTASFKGGISITEIPSADFDTTNVSIRVGSNNNYYSNTRVDFKSNSMYSGSVRYKVVLLNQGSITPLTDDNVSALSYSKDYTAKNRMDIAGGAKFICKYYSNSSPSLGYLSDCNFMIKAGVQDGKGEQPYGLYIWDEAQKGTVCFQSGYDDGRAIPLPMSLQPLGGNVGIGTQSPNYNLHVIGDMAATGRAIVDSLQIDNITISYDAANKGLRIDGVTESVLIPPQSGTVALTSQIPTNNNQLTNGAGYITSSGSCAYATTAGSANSVAWSNVSGRPTKLSDFTDDVVSSKYLSLSTGGTVQGAVHFNSIVSGGDAPHDYGYGIFSCTRPADGAYCCYSFVMSRTMALGLGYDSLARIILGSPNAVNGNGWRETWLTISSKETIAENFIANNSIQCNGQGSFNSLQIGNITISYDAANKGLRIAGGGLYTDSYLSSLGVDASTALSVKKWADSINLTEESDAELATAYSIGNLYRLINSNQESITQSLNQSVSALQGRCTSLEQRVSALENKVNK